MTAYDSIQELRDLYASLEARIAKLETLVKHQAPSHHPPTQEEIVHAEYGFDRFIPTEAQLSYARDIAKILGHNTDFSKLSRADVSEYINRYKAEYYRRRNEKERLRQDAAKMVPLEAQK